jgi:hypothetical protein
MKWFSFLVLFLLCAQDSLTQKLYVWCPKDQEIKARAGFLNHDTINLSIFDGRILTKNSKIECDANDILSSLALIIKQAYPSAFINVLGDSGYYADPSLDRITLKIGIAAFHAGFGLDISVGIGSFGGKFAYGAFPKGEWNGITGYYVRLYDNRSGKDQKFTSSISKVSSKPNMWGYKTAKDCLNTTYIEANQELLFFIDNNLTK